MLILHFRSFNFYYHIEFAVIIFVKHSNVYPFVADDLSACINNRQFEFQLCFVIPVFVHQLACIILTDNFLRSKLKKITIVIFSADNTLYARSAISTNMNSAVYPVNILFSKLR